MLVAAVAPALRTRGEDETMRLIARRFGLGCIAALALAVATGIAVASHFSLWPSHMLQIKLMVLVLVVVLTILHTLSPTSRTISCAITAASLLVVWLGVKLTYR